MTIAVIDTESFLCIHCHRRRLLAIACAKYHVGDAVAGNVMLSYVRPQTGCTVDEQSFRVHGITTEQAAELGQPLHNVLQQTVCAIKGASAIAAHDVHADINLLVDEAVSTNCTALLYHLASTKMLCTKLLTTRILRMQMPQNVDAPGWKWPSLREAFAYATGGQKYNEHNPMADVLACVHVLQSLPGSAFTAIEGVDT